MSKHKMSATIPHGDPDIGAEIDCEIEFNYVAGAAPIIYPSDNADPGWPAEVELISVKANLLDMGAFQDLQQKHLEDVVSDWLQDAGYEKALEVVASDSDAAAEYAADLRDDR